MDLMIILQIALATIGVIEWLKSTIKSAPVIVWALSMPVVAVICALLQAFVPVLFTGVLVVGTVQLFYDTIIQTAKKAIVKLGR